MREPTPTSKIIGVVFGTHTLLGPWELDPFLTQTNLVAKFSSCILSQQNLARWPLRQQCVQVYTSGPKAFHSSFDDD